MGQFHWDPAKYLDLMLAEVPDYERLQAEAVAAASPATRILELGIGTGETSRRLLDADPGATIVGIDASAGMLERAARALPAGCADLRLARMEDRLPDGPFDAVVAVLTVHHLDGPAKADLFGRAAERLGAGGRLVLGDVVVPADPADAVTPLDPVYDVPSEAAEQLRWLEDAGLRSRLAWASRDLAVLVGLRERSR